MLILAEFLANGVPFKPVLQKGVWICLWYRCTYYVLVSKSDRNLFKPLTAETCHPALHIMHRLHSTMPTVWNNLEQSSVLTERQW